MANSPRLKKRFARIRRITRMLRAEFEACRRDAEAVSEHLDYSVEGCLTVGACDAAIEECDRTLRIFE
jgi:hypothetical protein